MLMFLFSRFSCYTHSKFGIHVFEKIIIYRHIPENSSDSLVSKFSYIISRNICVYVCVQIFSKDTTKHRFFAEYLLFKVQLIHTLTLKKYFKSCSSYTINLNKKYN